MSFRFRAAALLDLRRKQLEDARAILAHTQQALADASRALDHACAARDRAEVQFQAALVAGVDGGEVERHRNWITLQKTVVNRRGEAREACQLAVTQAAAVVMDRRRQVRVLERLRERALRRYEAEMRRREMKEIDLFATLKHARRIVDRET